MEIARGEKKEKERGPYSSIISRGDMLEVAVRKEEKGDVLQYLSNQPDGFIQDCIFIWGGLEVAIGYYREGALKSFLGVSTSGKVLRKEKKITHIFIGR